MRHHQGLNSAARGQTTSHPGPAARAAAGRRNGVRSPIVLASSPRSGPVECGILADALRLPTITMSTMGHMTSGLWAAPAPDDSRSTRGPGGGSKAGRTPVGPGAGATGPMPFDPTRRKLHGLLNDYTRGTTENRPQIPLTNQFN